jgi:hypothetical protein
MIVIMTSSPLLLSGAALYRMEGCFLDQVILRCPAISRTALEEHLDILVQKMCTTPNPLVDSIWEGWWAAVQLPL